MPKTKRSERLGVNLTPDEYNQVSERAEQQNSSISNYARRLLLSPLAADLIQGRSQEQQCHALEQKLGELSGILNLLSSDLADQRHLPSATSEIQPLVQQLNSSLDETLAAMRSMQTLLEQLR